MKQYLTMYDALALLPVNLVIAGFEELKRRNPYPNSDGVNKFIDYKERYFIGLPRSNRRGRNVLVFRRRQPK